MKQPLLTMEKISKKFGSIYALQDVDLEIYSGEVHALLGENGAGKSTLMKILTGIYTPTSGAIKTQNHDYKEFTPKQARNERISIIYQELSVIDELSVLENLFVGQLPRLNNFPWVADWKYMKTKAQAVFEKMGIDIQLEQAVEDISISYKQMVEIAKALLSEAKILIMDEPTSSLTDTEITALFKIIEDLKSQGVAIIYISHKLKEIQQIADRYSVLKDGQIVDTGLCDGKDNDYYIKRMVGRDIMHDYVDANRDPNAPVLLQIKNLSSRKDKRIQNINFDVREGEIIGFFGLVGSGRTELMNCLFGADKISSGQIIYKGKDITPKNPLHAVKNGIAYVTENRRKTGFFDNFSIRKNIVIPKAIKDNKYGGMGGIIHKKAEQKIALYQSQQFAVKSQNISQNITELSGGNQQKVIIGKWMALHPHLMIFDEPTRGIDVGAKSEIYRIMRAVAETHVAVIMVSSELPEILAICDRIAVFADGEISHILDHREANEDMILEYALKHKENKKIEVAI